MVKEMLHDLQMPGKMVYPLLDRFITKLDATAPNHDANIWNVGEFIIVEALPTPLPEEITRYMVTITLPGPKIHRLVTQNRPFEIGDPLVIASAGTSPESLAVFGLIYSLPVATFAPANAKYNLDYENFVVVQSNVRPHTLHQANHIVSQVYNQYLTLSKPPQFVPGASLSSVPA